MKQIKIMLTFRKADKDLFNWIIAETRRTGRPAAAQVVREILYKAFDEAKKRTPVTAGA